MTVKSVVLIALVGGLASIAAPVAAQDAVLAELLTDVCLPYANRAQSFER
jgi:hypothetical protein